MTTWPKPAQSFQERQQQSDADRAAIKLTAAENGFIVRIFSRNYIEPSLEAVFKRISEHYDLLKHGTPPVKETHKG